MNDDIPLSLLRLRDQVNMAIGLFEGGFMRPFSADEQYEQGHRDPATLFIIGDFEIRSVNPNTFPPHDHATSVFRVKI